MRQITGDHPEKITGLEDFECFYKRIAQERMEDFFSGLDIPNDVTLEQLIAMFLESLLDVNV